MVMGNFKNLHVFNFAILLKSQKKLMLAKYTRFTVYWVHNALLSMCIGRQYLAGWVPIHILTICNKTF